MNEYICERCKGRFINPTPEFLRIAEAERNFGEIPDDPVSLCENCYQWFMYMYSRLTPEERAEIDNCS